MTKRKQSKTVRTERKMPTTKECGLYLIGSTYFNPHTRKEKYFVKVGMASALKSRMGNYRTHNPGVWHIDYRVISPELVGDKEIYCHNKLNELEIDIQSDCDHKHTEWTQVSRQNYLKICEKGFDYFKEL